MIDKEVIFELKRYLRLKVKEEKEQCEKKKTDGKTTEAFMVHFSFLVAYEKTLNKLNLLEIT